MPLPYFHFFFYFNPRSREGSDFPFTLMTSIFHKFQSTLPRGERLIKLHKPHSPSEFQSTLPRGERRFLDNLFTDAAKISIHAPARGATTDSNKYNEYDKISIHAPARGATCAKCNLKHLDDDFNPRSREGSDIIGQALQVSTCKFQSTLPRGERHHPYCTAYTIHQISIHAPARGATTPPGLPPPPSQISIHAPARGATIQPLLRVQCVLISIHAPARGATSLCISPSFSIT